LRGKGVSRVPLLFSTPGAASLPAIEYIAMLECCPFCRSSYEYNTALINHIAAKHPEQAELYFHESTTDDQK
jgi:hypothetical protein